MQRCAVRVTYAPNRTRGQWSAHGRYLARESAVHSDTGNMRAFGPSGPVADIHRTLGSWQKAGDPRLFKLIISPEFGERVDLERLTRDLIADMEQDLGTHFEWVATAHHNTEHPHTHVALRGVTPQRKPVFFPAALCPARHPAPRQRVNNCPVGSAYVVRYPRGPTPRGTATALHVIGPNPPA
jgi:hypothetical protein